MVCFLVPAISEVPMKVADEGYFAEGIATFSLVCRNSRNCNHDIRMVVRQLVKIIWCPLADFRGSAEVL